MLSRSYFVGVAFIALSLLAGGVARAAAIPVVSGDEYGGWLITISPGITLTDNGVSSGVLHLEKDATFNPGDNVTEGLFIDFYQEATDDTLAPQIQIDGETITNSTGVAWGGFQFLLTTTNNISGSPAAFDNSSAIFDTGPDNFSSSSFSSNTVTYSGGTVANGGTVLFGDAIPDGSSLLIDGNPAGAGGQEFQLKELPTTVPLPSAAPAAMSVFLAMGLVLGLKKLRNAASTLY